MTADNQAGQTGQPAKGRRTATDIPDDPQELADELLDTALRQNPGKIRDDMTVIVARCRNC